MEREEFYGSEEVYGPSIVALGQVVGGFVSRTYTPPAQPASLGRLTALHSFNLLSPAWWGTRAVRVPTWVKSRASHVFS